MNIHVPKTPKETTAELQTRFDYADSWREQYDERAVTNYQLYVGYKEEVEGRSNLHIPRTYEEVDTLRARLYSAFVGARPYFEFVPSPRNAQNPQYVQMNEIRAQIATSVLDQQLERTNFDYKFYNFLTSMLIFPAAIMSVGWNYDIRPVKRKVQVPRIVYTPFGPQVITQTQVVERPELLYDDNEVLNVDFFDFWPDPRGTDIDSCRFVFQREWMTPRDIEEMLAVHEKAGAGDVYWPDWNQIGDAGGLEEGKWERISAVDLAPETRSGNFEHEGDGQLYEVLHYWEDQRHAILINRSTLVYDGANPYWRHSKKPFIMTSFEPLPHEIYGMSAVRIIEHLQEELNTNRNQRIDNVSMVLNRMWLRRRGADIDDADLISRPHGVIDVDDIQQDIAPLLTPDVTASSYNEEAIIKTDMENALMVPPEIRGVGSDKETTATQATIRASNAQTRFRVKTRIFNAIGLKRLCMLMDLNNQQFIDKPRLVKVYGIEGPAAWQMISPDQIVGEWGYRPASGGLDPIANREAQQQQLAQIMEAAKGNPFLDLYEATKAYVNSFEVRGKEKFVIPKERVIQQMLAAQQSLPQPAQGQPRQQPP